MIDYQSGVAPNAVNKMYKRELFSDDCLYPIGKLYEDMGVTAKLFNKCNKIVYTPDCYYYYLQREDSITNEIFKEKRFGSYIYEQTFYMILFLKTLNQ